MAPAARLVLLGLLPIVLGGCGMSVAKREKQYREQQVRALVTEYEQARMRGDLLGLCVKSNLISGAYLDVGATGDASAWRARNAEDCQAARAALAPNAASLPAGTNR